MVKGKSSNELSYFRAALLHFLKEYHPHIAGNRQLVDMRAASAEEVFYSLVKEGEDIHTANSLALEELFSGLEFSLYYLIYDIIRENEHVPVNRYRSLSNELLPLCNPILDSYKGIDFLEDEIGYTLLCQELGDAITKHLKDNGIQ